MKYFFAFIGLVLGILTVISLVAWAAVGHSFWVPIGPGDEDRAFVLCMMHFVGLASLGGSIVLLLDAGEDNTFAGVDRHAREHKVTTKDYEWDIQNYPVYKKPTPSKLLEFKRPTK